MDNNKKRVTRKKSEPAKKASPKKTTKQTKEAHQSWKPHWMSDTAYKIWLSVFTAFKIGLGALLTVVLICIVCGFVFLGILGAYIERDIIPEAQIMKENYSMDETSYIHYVDEKGEIQELQRIYAATDREWAKFSEIPQALIDAAVSIEDKRFYEHQGVDWITTVKACASMFFGTGDAGGSTITQQLVKNMTQDDSVTVRRKIVEICKAYDFERKYDKNTVMEWYLNLIYFGDRKNGVKSAAAHYFGKELELLTPAECASLISITNNPSIFSPYASEQMYKGKLTTGVERNHIRKENTLWMMRNEGYLTEAEYQEALAQKLEFKSGIAFEDRLAVCENEACQYRGAVKTLTAKDEKYFCPNCEHEISVGDFASQEVYSWFVDTVLEDVGAILAADDGMDWEMMNKKQREVYLQMIQRGGFHIYSTLDKKVQDQVDKIYQDLTQIPETRGGQQLQSGIVIIDNRTGDIVALAGGVGEKTTFDGYNMATDAKRQPGSALKPLSVYAPGFEMGVITPATVLKDLPMQYIENPENNEVSAYPKNSPVGYDVSSTVLNGVTHSLNTISIYTLDTIGTRYSFNFLKDRFKLSNLVESDRFGNTDIAYSPLAMGGLTKGATVREMANAYATFANKGTYRMGRTFTKVYDSKGNIIIDNTQKSEKIITEKTADYVNYCLDSAVNSGTGSLADLKSIGMDVSGKTGTTNSKKDRYFCGYTGYYTAAVWCGFETPAEIQEVGGGNAAARLWKKVMQPLHKGKENIPLFNKDRMVEVTVCLDSGKLATDACVCDVRGDVRTKTVLIYEEDMPTETCDKHVALDYCVTGGGCANEYCKKFAAVGLTLMKEQALVKLTQAQIDELLAAEKYDLNKSYLDDKYVYLVDEFGNPIPFTGFKGEINLESTDNCVGCHVHTKEAWEAYLAEHPWADNPYYDDIWDISHE